MVYKIRFPSDWNLIRQKGGLVCLEGSAHVMMGMIARPESPLFRISSIPPLMANIHELWRLSVPAVRRSVVIFRMSSVQREAILQHSARACLQN